MTMRSKLISLGLLLAAIPVAIHAASVDVFTGSYKQALRKAAEVGKPLMIDFYTDWCPQCKVMDKVVTKIPDTMNKFVYLRVNAERDVPLARQFKVKGYPTVVLLKPDGTEFHRWAGAYRTPEDMTQVLESALKKAGSIQSAQAPTQAKPTTATVAPRPAPNSVQETAARGELSTAQTYLTVGRRADAKKTLQHIIDKYPDTQAAEQAREKLDQLSSTTK